MRVSSAIAPVLLLVGCGGGDLCEPSDEPVVMLGEGIGVFHVLTEGQEVIATSVSQGGMGFFADVGTEGLRASEQIDTTIRFRTWFDGDLIGDYEELLAMQCAGPLVGGRISDRAADFNGLDSDGDGQASTNDVVPIVGHGFEVEVDVTDGLGNVASLVLPLVVSGIASQ